MSRRTGRRLVGAAAALLGLGFVFMGAGAASASQGSVPGEVATYAADPKGLLARLDDLFGAGAGGEGIDFDDTTKVGQLNRVFTFTSDFLGGAKTDIPVERQNEWSAPITIADKPVGLAIIWINPATVEPELADFTTGPEIGSAIADVPADAYLVHDEPRAAWFTLTDSTLTPLVAGTSGVTAETSLTAYLTTLKEQAAAVPAEPLNLGSVLSVVTIVVVVLAIIAALLVPFLRARKREADAAAPARPAVVPLATAAPARAPAGKPAISPTAKPSPATTTKPTGKPTVKPAASPARAAPKSLAPKPPAPKSLAPNSSAPKPPVSKPAASKPAARKSVPKPPARPE